MQDYCRLVVILLAWLFLSTFISFPSHAIPLKEALGIAYQNNPQLKAERERLKAIDENLPQAYAGWLPTISANYSTSRERGRTGSVTRDTYSNPHQGSLTLTQNLFEGGKTIAEINRAHNLIAASRNTLRQVEQQVLTTAIIAYIDLVRTREVYKLSLNNERVLKEQLEATNARFKLGETTRTDVAQAESRLAVAKSDRIDAEGNVLSAESDFKRVYDIEVPKDVVMPSNLPDVPDDYEELLKLALQQDPRLKSAEYNYKSALSNINAARADILPSVDFTSDMSQSGGGGIGRLNSSTSETVRLSINVPLYQSGAEYSLIRQNKRSAQAAKYEMERTEDTTHDSATKAWKDLTTTRSTIKARQASVKAATVALDGVRQEQEIGSRTVLDVLDAEQELFEAKVNLVIAERNKVLATYNVLAAIGELTADSLQLPTEIYDPDVHFGKVKYQMFGF